MTQEAREMICNVKGHKQCECWMGGTIEHAPKGEQDILQPHCRVCGNEYEEVTDIDAILKHPFGGIITYPEDE